MGGEGGGGDFPSINPEFPQNLKIAKFWGGGQFPQNGGRNLLNIIINTKLVNGNYRHIKLSIKMQGNAVGELTQMSFISPHLEIRKLWK